MKITDMNDPRIVAGRANDSDIADGTFCLVRQQWLLELVLYATTAGDVWEVIVGRLPVDQDTIYNSSYVHTGWQDRFTAERVEHYWDNSAEAHQFMADFIMGDQITEV